MNHKFAVSFLIYFFSYFQESVVVFGENSGFSHTLEANDNCCDELKGFTQFGDNLTMKINTESKELIPNKHLNRSLDFNHKIIKILSYEKNIFSEENYQLIPTNYTENFNENKKKLLDQNIRNYKYSPGAKTEELFNIFRNIKKYDKLIIENHEESRPAVCDVTKGNYLNM